MFICSLITNGIGSFKDDSNLLFLTRSTILYRDHNYIFLDYLQSTTLFVLSIYIVFFIYTHYTQLGLCYFSYKLYIFQLVDRAIYIYILVLMGAINSKTRELEYIYIYRPTC